MQSSAITNKPKSGLYHNLDYCRVLSALSYYSDHQKEIQKYIEENRVPDKLIDPLVQSTQ